MSRKEQRCGRSIHWTRDCESEVTSRVPYRGTLELGSPDPPPSFSRARCRLSASSSPTHFLLLPLYPTWHVSLVNVKTKRSETTRSIFHILVHRNLSRGLAISWRTQRGPRVFLGRAAWGSEESCLISQLILTFVRCLESAWTIDVKTENK